MSRMDIKRIGMFLKELRKQNNMTQEQLGERLGVTNKTISRWETGNYMPPIECLKRLSELYIISINEIISGKRLNEENYKSEAEENITVAFEQMESKSIKIDNFMIALLCIINAFTIITIFLMSGLGYATTTEKVKGIIVIIFVVIMACIANSSIIAAAILRKDK